MRYGGTLSSPSPSCGANHVQEPLTDEEHEACVELVLEIEEAAAEWEFSGLPGHLSDPLESWYVHSYQIGREGNRGCIPQDHHGTFLF